jgi:hypothetical protein
MFNTHLIVFILKSVHANVGYHKLVKLKKKKKITITIKLRFMFMISPIQSNMHFHARNSKLVDKAC